jgi:hypothetical protein
MTMVHARAGGACTTLVEHAVSGGQSWYRKVMWSAATASRRFSMLVPGRS